LVPHHRGHNAGSSKAKFSILPFLSFLSVLHITVINLGGILFSFPSSRKTTGGLLGTFSASAHGVSSYRGVAHYRNAGETVDFLMHDPQLDQELRINKNG
jgi:hypothetical protein